MLYPILKPVMKLAVWLAYRRIVRTGLEHIENGRPTLILANHSASFMDAVLMGVFTRRRIHFFARGDVFAHPLANRILRSLGMMPIFRVSEGKENMHRNEDTNAEALKVLAQGGAVLIFAEGVSALEKMLKPLKKGPFRLAALAAAKGIDLVIVPTGINYVRPGRIGDDVFIVAGERIDVGALYNEAGGAEARLATLAMRDTEASLRKVVWDARDKAVAAIADDALLRLQRNITFSFAQGAGAITALNALDDAAVANAYVSGRLLEMPELQQAPGRAELLPRLIVALMAPFITAGFLFHFIPAAAARLTARKTVKAPDFYAPVFVAASVILIFFWYMMAGILLLIFFKKGLLLLPLIALCGILYRKPQTRFRAPAPLLHKNPASLACV